MAALCITELILRDDVRRCLVVAPGGLVEQWQDEMLFKFGLRFQLGEQLGDITRHLLLMTATPHSGKEEDFQLFLTLLDRDRFEGRPKATADTSGIMRRMIKEDLLTFEGKKPRARRIASIDGTAARRHQYSSCRSVGRNYNSAKPAKGWTVSTFAKRVGGRVSSWFRSVGGCCAVAEDAA